MDYLALFVELLSAEVLRRLKLRVFLRQSFDLRCQSRVVIAEAAKQSIHLIQILFRHGQVLLLKLLVSYLQLRNGVFEDLDVFFHLGDLILVKAEFLCVLSFLVLNLSFELLNQTG